MKAIVGPVFVIGITNIVAGVGNDKVQVAAIQPGYQVSTDSMGLLAVKSGLVRQCFASVIQRKGIKPVVDVVPAVING